MRSPLLSRRVFLGLPAAVALTGAARRPPPPANVYAAKYTDRY